MARTARPDDRTNAQVHRLWQTARVIEDEAGNRWLEFDDPTRCERCRRGEGCGAAQWARLFGAQRTQRLPLDDGSPWPAGTRVRAGLEARVLLRMALRAYGIPLLSFVAAVVLADRLGAHEAVALAVAAAAAVGSLYGARSIALRGRSPHIEAWGEACDTLESADR